MITFYSYLIQFLGVLHPKISARLVHHLLSNPQIQQLHQREAAVLDMAEQWKEAFRAFQIHVYAWGVETGTPLLLVHGWEGHTGNFAALVKPLTDRGFRVFGFDAPAHGRSSRGATDMFQYSQFLTDMIHKYQPGVIISHSFGTTSAALALCALKKYKLHHWIMIASPHTFNSRIETVRKQYNIPVRTISVLRPLIEQRSEQKINDLNFDHYSKYLEKVDHIPVIHSRADRVVAYKYAEDIHKALPDSQLIPLDEVGHFSILWSAELREHIDHLLPNRLNKSQ